ncbi:hypothetical protein ONE63_009369 [Megalurothrips usitatus]|uniref:Phosphatidylinositol-4,5-bisphosphate 4-phosphatase n=1 Tax=Megalurothrips usitatus TaxID=439358 RepID=A0AAV7XJD8_9NEOP|nr:hypothetical protein ONE63_009369 [Megalurothrips usitatus]
MPIQGEPDKPPWPHRRPGPDGNAGGSLGGKPAPATSSSAMLAADCEPLRGDLAPESAEGPLRGVLASRGSVPWNWAWWFRTAYWSPPVVGLPVPVGLAEDPLAEPAPPAAAEAAVEARRFVCECCKRMSFVLPADVSTYIICPFCGKLSTTDASKSKRMANTYFFLGTAFPIVVTMLFVILDEFLDRSAQRYVPVYFRLLLFLFVSAVCLKRAWDFQSLPRGSLLGGYLYVLPDLHHVAGKSVEHEQFPCQFP